MVEHSTADREVPGSNPGAPSFASSMNVTLSTTVQLDILVD